MKKLILIASLLASLCTAKAYTNFVWVPFGHPGTVSMAWTNSPQNTYGSWSNWWFVQAMDYNVDQLWQKIDTLPQLGRDNTWTGSNRFYGPYDMSTNAFAATNHPPGLLGNDGTNWYWTTNAFGSMGTNAAPSGVVIGVTANDAWVWFTNGGVGFAIPAWNNH